MNLVLANPAGLWALLGVPVVLAIHFLQPKSRRAVITTLFLLEHLPPLTSHGRTWRWLRSSWALWLQLLAVVLLAWLLAEPRWLRPDSLQSIALVLDASASMRPFRGDAETALRRRMPEWERRAARTEWIVRDTDLRMPALYRGFDRAGALAAIATWEPTRPQHDVAPALELARQLVRRAGATVFVTDRRPERLPAGVALFAVGRPIENVGFVGGAIDAEGSPARWTVIVRNHGRAPAARPLQIARSDGAVVRTEELALEPGQLLTLSGLLPAETRELEFRLAPDAFDFDDALPLIAPQPRRLTWRVTGPERTTAFFRRVFERTPALRPASPQETPDLDVRAVSSFPDTAAAFTDSGALAAFAVGFSTEHPGDGKLAGGAVFADAHAWASDLAWAGLLGTGPLAHTPPPRATPLLWQENHPLAWIEHAGGRPRVVFAWDWAASNADRLPATAVLVHRVIEHARARKPGPEARNVDAGQLLALPESGAGERLTIETAAGRTSAAPGASLHAPARPGFFTVRAGGQVVLHGAAQFTDAREGDFGAAETLLEPEELPLDPVETQSVADRWRPFWIVLALAAVLGSWAVQMGPTRRAAPARENA